MHIKKLPTEFFRIFVSLSCFVEYVCSCLVHAWVVVLKVVGCGLMVAELAQLIRSR